MLCARMDFGGIRVLDLYAGSGALGLEALSRGASHALLVESDRKAAAVLRGNIADLALPGAELRMGTVSSVLAGRPGEPYDLVLSDPPYALDSADITADLSTLAANGWLHPGALVVIERASRSPETSWPEEFSANKPRRYGETRIETADYEPRAQW